MRQPVTSSPCLFPNYILTDSTQEVAKKLLGAILVRTIDGMKLSGRIVETEAYLFDDPASHAYRGLTKRNTSMFGEAGTVYIYVIYGIHYALNIVTREATIGEAVLIRALEPLSGIDSMKQKRGTDNLVFTTNGPGKLCQALAIDASLNGHNLHYPPLQICSADPIARESIVTTARIGITKAVDLPLRFYIKDSAYISRR